MLSSGIRRGDGPERAAKTREKAGMNATIQRVAGGNPTASDCSRKPSMAIEEDGSGGEGGK
jgi:hypothetical protein